MRSVLAIMILLWAFNSGTAQEGFLKIDAAETWIIKLDSAAFQTADTLLALPEGTQSITARPLLNYSWPGVLLTDTLQISTADTLFYTLENARARQVSMNRAEDMLLNEPYTPEFPAKQVPAWRGKVKTGLIITAIAGNWLSFYLKRQADDAYSSYKKASGLGQINNKWDETRLYDNLSSAALAISATALSGYIYLELTD